MSSPDARLIQAAADARRNAVCDITGYAVGAAVQAQDGSIHQGCNIENIVLGATVCAEKVALFKAISEGHHRFDTVAVFTRSSPPATPCGSCRQLLFHWGVQRVVSSNPEGEVAEWSMGHLLPDAFAI